MIAERAISWRDSIFVKYNSEKEDFFFILLLKNNNAQFFLCTSKSFLTSPLTSEEMVLQSKVLEYCLRSRRVTCANVLERQGRRILVRPTRAAGVYYETRYNRSLQLPSRASKLFPPPHLTLSHKTKRTNKTKKKKNFCCFFFCTISWSTNASSSSTQILAPPSSFFWN